jgi:hypothetical protein
MTTMISTVQKEHYRLVTVSMDENMQICISSQMVQYSICIILFQDRVGSIYLLYSLYYLQPANYAVKIRITAEQLVDLHQFIDQRLRPDGHLDTMYVLYKMFADCAFSVVAYAETVCGGYFVKYSF